MSTPDFPTVRPAGSLRVGFAGTPEFAARILEALIRAGHAPVVVYCQPDRPAGRGRRLTPPPVKRLALQHGLPVRQPPSLRGDHEAGTLGEYHLDVLIVAAYGLILPPGVLTVPRLGCINVHASLLPRWRGAAPVERAIMAGDTETGVSIMQMEAGLDTGPVYLKRTCPIEADCDAPALEARLAELGGAALLECLARLPDLVPQPQPEAGVTYASKLTRADSAIHWEGSAGSIERQIRALAGRMPAHTHLDSVRLNVLEARTEATETRAPAGTIIRSDRDGIRVACGDGVLNVQRLQLNLGKGRPLSAADAVNGYGPLLAPGRQLHGPVLPS